MQGNTNFYIKIPTGFFESMIMLDLYDLVGHEGKLITLELMLLTANRSGVLADVRPDGSMRPFTARTIKNLTRGHDEEVIQQTLDALIEIGFARQDPDGTYIILGMEDGGEYVGKDTGAARYMRQYRAAKKAEGEEVKDIPEEPVVVQEEEPVQPAPEEKELPTVVQEIYDNLDTAEKKQYSKLLHSMTQKRYDTLCKKYTAERVNHTIGYVMRSVTATGNKNSYKSLPRVVENYISNGWDKWTGKAVVHEKKQQHEDDYTDVL